MTKRMREESIQKSVFSFQMRCSSTEHSLLNTEYFPFPSSQGSPSVHHTACQPPTSPARGRAGSNRTRRRRQRAALQVPRTTSYSFPYSIAVPAYSPGPRGKPGLPFRQGQRMHGRGRQPQGGAVGAILLVCADGSNAADGAISRESVAPKWKPVGSSHGLPTTNRTSPARGRAGSNPDQTETPSTPDQTAAAIRETRSGSSWAAHADTCKASGWRPDHGQSVPAPPRTNGHAP